jgi:hypothetical protein
MQIVSPMNKPTIRSLTLSSEWTQAFRDKTKRPLFCPVEKQDISFSFDR